MSGKGQSKLESLLGEAVRSTRTISESAWARVERVRTESGQDLILKSPLPGHPATCRVEGEMLGYLARNSELPVPTLVAYDDAHLVMDFVEGHGSINLAAEEDAARHLAALHAITALNFGFERDTIIGPLTQPNPRANNWRDFFAEHRLLHMAHMANQAGRLPSETLRRVEMFAGKLSGWVGAENPISLVHGDLWQGNLIIDDGRIAAFIDPAIYFGHAEMDLAFSTLFNTFGQSFFDAYGDIRPIEPDFFDCRLHIWNLWPLLVHVKLFGGGYLASVQATLTKFGC